MDGRHLIVLLFMLATFLVLVVGLTLMTKGGALNRKYGNKLMVARVVLQGLTLGLLALMFFIGKK